MSRSLPHLFLAVGYIFKAFPNLTEHYILLSRVLLFLIDYTSCLRVFHQKRCVSFSWRNVSHFVICQKQVNSHLHYTVYSVQYSVNRVQSTVYSTQFSDHIGQCTLHPDFKNFTNTTNSICVKLSGLEIQGNGIFKDIFFVVYCKSILIILSIFCVFCHLHCFVANVVFSINT